MTPTSCPYYHYYCHRICQSHPIHSTHTNTHESHFYPLSLYFVLSYLTLFYSIIITSTVHFHKMDDCPNCVFKGNAIENSQQRGIIIHSTHNTLVEDNVLYNVRGANIYLEDGNEMWNTLKYNVAICPFPFRDTTYHGCTVSGTSNRVADTADNQSGFFSRAGSNNFIGNRASNHFNGMFLQEGGRGRGDESYDKVCESASRLGRFDGNTWHSNGRFGT